MRNLSNWPRRLLVRQKLRDMLIEQAKARMGAYIAGQDKPQLSWRLRLVGCFALALIVTIFSIYQPPAQLLQADNLSTVTLLELEQDAQIKAKPAAIKDDLLHKYNSQSIQKFRIIIQALAKGLLSLIICWIFASILSRNKLPRPEYANRYFFTVLFLTALTICLPASEKQSWSLELFPAGLLCLIGTLGWRAPGGIVATVFCTLLLVIAKSSNTAEAMAVFFSCIVFSHAFNSIRYRLSLIFWTMFAGFTAVAVQLIYSLALSETSNMVINPRDIYGFSMTSLDLFSWILVGLIAFFTLSWLEHFFGATTAIRLQELQSDNSPCLRQMMLQAPGTYHHSLIVALLAEAGAEAAGADALLARVGGYYHDIGKILRPEYFTENEGGVSRHDAIKNPRLSATILIAHVKDGLEIGRDYHLPPAIQDFIAQHHGNTVAGFFYERAKAQAKPGEVVDANSFRYPGPIPQSREAAILMLADVVEAASRSLDKPDVVRLTKLVEELTTSRLLAGELSESGLTFAELTRVKKAFVRTLSTVYHTRIKYPGKS